MNDETTRGESDQVVVLVKSSPMPWLLLLLVLLGAGALISFGKEQLDQAEARDAVSRQERALAQSERDELKAKLSVSQTSLGALESQLEGLTAEREHLANQLQERDAEISRLKATYDSLNQKMEAEIKRGEVLLTQSGGRVRVELVDKVLFDSGEAALSERGAEVLSRVGEVLARVDDKTIQVSGHTDDAPITKPELVAKYATNWELSVARAVNVVRYLSESAKVPTGRLVAAGYGQYHPTASNATPRGRARNRRIEILLTPLLDAPKESARK